MMRRRVASVRLAAVLPAVVFLLSSGASAFSNGAGGNCPAGQPAVGEEHTNGSIWGTDRPVVQTSLVDAGIRFTINDFDLTAVTDDEVKMRFKGDYEFAVQADQPFKGVLIRVAQPSSNSGEMSFLPGTSSQTALTCAAAGDKAPVQGVTHVDAMGKTFLSGFFQSSATENVQIDVTVVLYNNSTGSVYAYQFFEVGVSAAHLTESPTAAPFPGWGSSSTTVEDEPSDVLGEAPSDTLDFGSVKSGAATAGFSMFMLAGCVLLTALRAV